MKGSDRMKKIINSLFMFILGGIIFGSIVYATTYYAKDVAYEPTDASWEVSNVNDALDNLYSPKNNNKLELPYYVYPGDRGAFAAYYSTSTTFNVSNGTTGVLGKFNLSGVSGMTLDIHSFNTSYTGTIHICVCEELPTSLEEMKNAPIYATYSASSRVSKKIDFGNKLDSSKEYWLFFYSNSIYGSNNGYTSMAFSNMYFY